MLWWCVRAVSSPQPEDLLLQGDSICTGIYPYTLITCRLSRLALMLRGVAGGMTFPSYSECDLKKFSQKFEMYKKLATDLKRRVAIQEACPFAGALTETQKDVQEDDNDRVQPIFTRKLGDFSRQPNQDQGRAITEAIRKAKHFFPRSAFPPYPLPNDQMLRSSGK